MVNSADRKVSQWLTVVLSCMVGFASISSSAGMAGELTTSLHNAEIEQGPNWQFFSKLDKAGFALLDSGQSLVQAKNQQQFYVPASTTKLITALLAIEHWGLEHRFHTDFYIRHNAAGQPVLLVKGYGDPFLVSEELIEVAKQLKTKLVELGVDKLAGIELDASYYHPRLIMPGTSNSLNPYDAIPSAIAANFNTINALKQQNAVASSEAQTPMVPVGEQIVRASSLYQSKASGKKFRINLGDDVKQTQRYFAELLSAFLKEQGMPVDNSVEWHPLETTDQLVYRHFNSRTLADVIKPMMKYSTNFIANQLALNLSAELLGGQADKDKVQQAYTQLLKERFGWQEFYLEDGAGLSRRNRLAPNQLIDVLQAFKPWIALLPEIERHVYAKSGTLIGVSTLAGYIDRNGDLLPFAMMINQKVPYRFRNKLAKELAQNYQPVTTSP